MDRAKETGKRCLAQETSFLAPSTIRYLCMRRNLELRCHFCVPSLLSRTWPKERASGLANRALGVTILGPRGHAVSSKEFCLGVEIGVPPQCVAPPIIFIFKRPRIGEIDFRSLLCPWMAPVQAVGGYGGSRPRGWCEGHTILTCGGHSITFNCQADASPFKLSSGVVLHKVLPMCFCLFFSVCIIAFL